MHHFSTNLIDIFDETKITHSHFRRRVGYSNWEVLLLLGGRCWCNWEASERTDIF